jgi:catalase
MNNQKQKDKKLTTASGRPYTENENTMTAGPRGPNCCKTSSFTKKWPTSIVNAFPKE